MECSRILLQVCSPARGSCSTLQNSTLILPLSVIHICSQYHMLDNRHRQCSHLWTSQMQICISSPLMGSP